MSGAPYGVCPHCLHPNVHVRDGRLAMHCLSVTSDTRCEGSFQIALEQHDHCMNRHTNEYDVALGKAQGK